MALLHLEGWEGIAPEFNSGGLNPNSAETLEFLRSTYHGRFTTANNSWHLRRGHDGRGMALAGGRDGAGAALWVGIYFPSPLATSAEVTIGARIKFQDNAGKDNNREMIRLTGLTSGGSGEARLLLSPTNALRVQYGTGTTVNTSANDVISDNGWHYIEWQTVLDQGSGGSYNVRVDGVSVLSGSGVRTSQNANAQCTGVIMWSPTGYNDTYEEMYLIDDWYILDDSGTVNNDFLGPIKVTGQNITGVGSSNDFVTFGAAGGKRDTNVQSNPVVDDTNGVQSVNTSTNKQTYKVEPYHATNIVGVAITSRFQNEDGFAYIDAKHRIDSGASNDNASEYTVLDHTEWTGLHSVHEEDPNTSTLWTRAALDAAEFGVEIG